MECVSPHAEYGPSGHQGTNRRFNLFSGIEAHMFSSQWFLTLFTAKFPLSLVYHVLDWFLMEGPNVIYRISLAMLRTWRRDLLALDFEGNNFME